MQATGDSTESARKRGKTCNWWGLLLLPLPPLVISAFVILAVGAGDIFPKLNPYGWLSVLIIGLFCCSLSCILVGIAVRPRCDRWCAVVVVFEVVFSLVAFLATIRPFSWMP